MLFIIILVSFIITLAGVYYCDNYSKYETPACITAIFFGIAFVVSIIALCFVFSTYHSTKSTVDKSIAVLQKRNDEVITSIQPFVDRFFEYESENLKEFKVSATNISALSLYPKLNGNQIIRDQIKVVLKNQSKITELELSKASLAQYKFWLFME